MKEEAAVYEEDKWKSMDFQSQNGKVYYVAYLFRVFSVYPFFNFIFSVLPLHPSHLSLYLRLNNINGSGRLFSAPSVAIQA